MGTIECKTTKKGCFIDKISADLKLLSLSKSDWWKGRHNDTRPIRSYQCEFCGFWHLTSKKKKEE